MMISRTNYMGLWWDNLHSRPLHCQSPWWAHQPCCDIWVVLGQEGVFYLGFGLYGGSVFRSHLRCWVCESLHEILLQFTWWWRQLRCCLLLQRHSSWCWNNTFVLMYTFRSASNPKRSVRDSHVPVLAPLPIGFAVFMDHHAHQPQST